MLFCREACDRAPRRGRFIVMKNSYSPISLDQVGSMIMLILLLLMLMSMMLMMLLMLYLSPIINLNDDSRQRSS